MTLLQIHEPGETPEPHDAPAIGIDLGTTHSVAAVQIGRELRMLPLQAGKALLPSIVTYQAEGSPVVGAGASGARIASIKRLMGRSLAEARELHPEQAFAPAEPVRLLLAGRQITPVEIAADILRAVAKAASDALGQTVARAVVTVPAYFDDGARQATKDAARLAGLEVLRLISEPTAAALAYGLAERAQGCYAVYDLGGGTFDISILTLEDGVFQVRATSGDLALGGDDIDRAIARRWAGEQGPITDALLAFARAAKEALSETPNVTVAERFTLDRDMLATLAAPYIERTLSLCASALADAALTLSQINGVVLVGGSTRMPLVRDAVTRYFGQTPYTGLNPDEVVARGAALQARALTEGADTLLLDVVPLSLGLETMGGLVEKLIHRNTPIPVQVTQEFTTYQDGQDGMMIHAVQGEREMVAQNRSLARFTLTGIPPLPAGIARIRVAFAVDADGLLTVSAREATTGAEQAIHVTPSYGLGEGDIERMLLESMRHAKDDILLRLLSEARVDAERALAEVTSALAQDQALLSKSEHDAIQRAMRLLQETMQGDQRETIDETREALYHATRIFAERRMDKAIHGALAGLHIDAAISPSPSPPAAVLHYDPVKRG